MDLLTECQEKFGTKNLYEILSIEKESTDEMIRKAYRQKSLKVHPDRVQGEHRKEFAKQTFQVLAKVYQILSNEESRKIYDEQGIILSGDQDLFSDQTTFEELYEYWRNLFPKIDMKKIDEFEKKYIGSDEEIADVRKLYLKFNGDLNLIFEHHLFYDEDRVCAQIQKMIDDDVVPSFKKFTKESNESKAKRLKRIEKERRLAEKEETKKAKNGNAELDLIAAIQKKNSNSFDNLIANLESKYSKSNAKKRRRN
ncbi:DNA polymerase delta catalytic subunit [Sarcoptes scabiei]|nr:DNA polymerase delta catalytic subunit [Sarcoptes scabiei]